jgi:hypothetical protein
MDSRPASFCGRTDSGASSGTHLSSATPSVIFGSNRLTCGLSTGQNSGQFIVESIDSLLQVGGFAKLRRR